MSIGSNIKRLRREKDITQEQLAEYLGITSRAISQWECDRTAPDISQLPALCHVFDVSSDVLLGIDVEKNEERIKSYLEEAHKVDWEGNFEKEVEILHFIWIPMILRASIFRLFFAVTPTEDLFRKR